MSNRSKAVSTSAQKRAEVILKVVSEQITATEGAKELGVSRKTFHKWLNRGMAGMIGSLEDAESGLPTEAVDAEKEKLRKEKEELEEKLKVMELKVRIQEKLGGSLNELLRGKTPPMMRAAKSKKKRK